MPKTSLCEVFYRLNSWLSPLLPLLYDGDLDFADILIARPLIGAVYDRHDDGFDFSEMQDLPAFLLLNWLSTILIFSHSSIWD